MNGLVATGFLIVIAVAIFSLAGISNAHLIGVATNLAATFAAAR